ncbi:MAG: putative peptidoglycan glycosyltransferase FtsW [Eubacteriales bacterium]|nr:putative peptidoglycan glycosyltransferase FtsW [Eubacteriales bacterium]
MKKTKSNANSGFYDYSLLAVIVLLICFGLIMLYSTSAYTAEIEFNDDMHYFRRQSIISAGSIVIAIFVSRADYHILKKYVEPLYIFALGLMLLVKTPLGVESNGARRWLKFGPFQFQPAEVAKIAVIVTMSMIIVHIGREIQEKRYFFILMMAGGIQAAAAYLFTDNLSTAIIIFGICFGMLFVARKDYKVFVGIVGSGLVLAVVGISYLYATMSQSSSFRLTRILVWLRPEQYADTQGYQTLQALYAIGSGGLMGRGLGNSIQKLGSVPEAQNDMIFSIICEELGIFGGVAVLLLFGYLLYRLFLIAQNAPDLFGTLLVSGIFIHMALQVVLNVAVVLNWLPNTGVTLPFISYGGTSIVFLMGEMGLALSVARQIRFEDE